MDIVFESRKLQKIFSSDKELSRAYGETRAQAIKRRILVLLAAANLDQVPKLPPDKCHPLLGQRKGQFAVYIGQPFRLIFEPAHDPIPTTPDGGVCLKSITCVRILGIEDYH
jgi:proteic killer suppression protein